MTRISITPTMRWMPCRGHSHHGRCWLHPKTATRLHLRCTNGCYTWRRHSISKKRGRWRSSEESDTLESLPFWRERALLAGVAWHQQSVTRGMQPPIALKFWLWPPQLQLALASTFKWTNDWWMCTSGTFHAHISMVHVPLEAVTRKVWPGQVGHGPTATESPQTPKLTSEFLPPLYPQTDVMIWFSQSLSSWKIYGFQAILFPAKIQSVSIPLRPMRLASQQLPSLLIHLILPCCSLDSPLRNGKNEHWEVSWDIKGSKNQNLSSEHSCMVWQLHHLLHECNELVAPS